jgi:hypothetical protein
MKMLLHACTSERKDAEIIPQQWKHRNYLKNISRKITALFDNAGI